MTTQEVNVQLAGPEEDCRRLLDRLREVADVEQVRGPYPRKVDGGVDLHVVAVPRQRAKDPGE